MFLIPHDAAVNDQGIAIVNSGGNHIPGRSHATGVKVIGFVAEEFDERNREALFAFFDLVSI